VWRPQFDQILLENSRKHGVDVREGHRVSEVLFDGDRVTGARFTSEAGEGIARTRHFVDATGKVGLLGRSLKLRQADPEFRNLAIYGYFSGGKKLAGEAENNIFIESYKQGWAWTIPLHTGVHSVGLVIDAERAQEAIQRDGPEEAYHRQLAMAPRTSAMLADASLEAGPIIIRDWSYLSERVAGEGWVLAGDAACFIDPLFSSGVHLALSAGVMAAAYVTTALKQPEIATAAGEAYQQLYYQQYGHFRELARLFYGSNRSVDSYFWEARQILDDEWSTPREAFIRGVAGQPPQGYERVVIARGDAPRAFTGQVEALESERARRTRQMAALVEGAASGGPLWQAIPRLAAGVCVERRAVLGEGEFEMGLVVARGSEDPGTPVSGLVAKLVALADGQHSVAQIVAELTAGLDPEAARKAIPAALGALRILYVDGSIEALEGV
jgi:2-polyprenyl-6-methoxyphenol hydroxylase-like FAD-dependent oxidoreductase